MNAWKVHKLTWTEAIDLLCVCVCVKCHQVAYHQKQWPIPFNSLSFFEVFFASFLLLFYLFYICFLNLHTDRSTPCILFSLSIFFLLFYLFFFSFIEIPTFFPFYRVCATTCMCICVTVATCLSVCNNVLYVCWPCPRQIIQAAISNNN